MSLKPQPIQPVPEETARVAQSAFPKGSPYMRLRDELGTVTNAEDGNAEIEDSGVALRRAFGMNAGGSTAKNDCRRIVRLDFVDRRAIGQNQAEYLRLTHAPRDQLAVLRAEIENHYRIGLRIHPVSILRPL